MNIPNTDREAEERENASTRPTDREAEERENASTRSTDRSSRKQTAKPADRANPEDESSFGSEAEVDAALDMTFPASDPPAWMGGGGNE